jgi:hypothetical protein
MIREATRSLLRAYPSGKVMARANVEKAVHCATRRKLTRIPLTLSVSNSCCFSKA